MTWDLRNTVARAMYFRAVTLNHSRFDKHISFVWPPQNDGYSITEFLALADIAIKAQAEYPASGEPTTEEIMTNYMPAAKREPR